MTFVNSKGQEFASMDEYMAEWWASLSRRDRAWQTVRRPFVRLDRHVRDAQLALRHAWQRVFRGWDDTAVWNLDSHLTATLGAQLVEMARIAHGWPGDGDYPGDDDTAYDRWVADLRKHGDALRAYAADDCFDNHEAVCPPARTALVWVANNLGALWD